METSKKLIGQQLSDLTLFAVDTPANHLAPQANAEEQTIHDTSGRGSEMPLAHYDPLTQSWRMSEDISLWGDYKLLENLPKSGMTLNGVLYQQPVWVRPIDETELLSWPTPTAVTRPMEGNVRMYRAKIKAGEMTEAEAEAILGKSVWEAQGKLQEIWPTPRNCTAMAATITPESAWNTKRFPNLETMVGRREWPTPTTANWVTSTSVEATREAMQNGEKYSSRIVQAVAMEEPTATGYLSPMWVEWLMGFPIGWTDLED